MSDEEVTLVDKKTTLDLVFLSLGDITSRMDEISSDSKLAVQEAREACRMSGENNTMLKALVASKRPPDLLRAGAPYAALLLAIIALVRAW